MTLIGGHLSRLFDINGRENRKPFWLWILIVYGAQTVLSTVAMFPLMFGMMRSIESLQQYDQTYLNEHPEIAQRVMMGAMGPFFRNIMIFAAVVGLFFVLMVGAAVVRRLHDGNRSGFWALPYLVIQLLMLATYAVLFPRFFNSITSLGPNPPPEAVNAVFSSVMPLFVMAGLFGMVGFIFMILLIVFLATRGTIGPNSYGDDLLPPPVFYPPPPQQYWQPAPPMPPPPPARVVGPWDRPPGT